VFPIPGANAALSGVIASGLSAESFTFYGFLPAKAGQRKTALEELRRKAVVETCVFYEAPHRIVEALADVEAVFGPGQHVVVARELTKLHEEFLRGSVDEVRATLAARESVRGEIVLLFAPAAAEQTPAKSLAEEIRELMREHGFSEMDALKRAAKSRGIGKSEAYRELQRIRGAGRG